MKSWFNLAKERAQELLAWFIAALLLLSAGWAGDGIKELFEAWLDSQALPSLRYTTVTGYMVVFIAALWGTAWVGRRYFLPRTRFMNNVESPEKREHLVLFLSDLDVFRGGYSNGVPEVIALSDDLEADIKTIECLKKTQRLMWQWEMPLRAIMHHIGRLKTITVVCSSKSLLQAPWFCAILHRYKALKDVTLWIYAKESHRPHLVECKDLQNRPLEGWDFEAFDDLSRALLWRLRMFREVGVNEREIMIDFTGGQKVTSVVAAMVTINRKVKTQYVQTDEPWKIIGYDVQMGSGETEGLGA